jgi:hypothetical protein
MRTNSHSIVALLATLSAVPPGILAGAEDGRRSNTLSTDNVARERNDLSGRDVLCNDDDQVARSGATH